MCEVHSEKYLHRQASKIIYTLSFCWKPITNINFHGIIKDFLSPVTILLAGFNVNDKFYELTTSIFKPRRYVLEHIKYVENTGEKQTQLPHFRDISKTGSNVENSKLHTFQICLCFNIDTTIISENEYLNHFWKLDFEKYLISNAATIIYIYKYSVFPKRLRFIIFKIALLCNIYNKSALSIAEGLIH